MGLVLYVDPYFETEGETLHIKRSWQFIAPLAAVALGVVLLLPGTSLAATAWHVAVGAQSQDKGRQANFYFNREITVDVGDNVQWTDNADEIHTVTFLAGTPAPPLFLPAGSGIAPNPAAFAPSGGPNFDGTAPANSGLLAAPGQQFGLTFTKAGDFSYVCLIHSTMSGIIHVQAKGAAYPETQRQYDVQSRIQSATDLGEAALLQGVGLVDAETSGRTNVTVGIGQLLSTGSLAVFRFEPSQKVIHAGQTVTWTNRDPETPHTVTFGTEPPGSPFGAFAPSGGVAAGHATISSPTQSVNSGFVGANFPFGTTFSATFTQPGTYPYICALHDTLGMTGTITVVP